jgi:glutathione S-transferase
VCFGATLRFMLQFDMLEKRASIVAYAERLAARPAHQRGAAANGAVIQERGLA